MYVISKTFEFSASHQLLHLPTSHQCSRLHGHNYAVTVVLRGELDADGFVLDYGALAPFKKYLDDHLDHRHLNDILPMPTAEHLAAMLYRAAKAILRSRAGVARVDVSETPKTCASYSEDA